MRKLVAAAAMALGLVTLPVTAAHAGSTWLVSIKGSRDQIVAGQRVVFTGTVRPEAAAAGKRLLFQERFKPGKPWSTVKKVTVGKHGTYAVADRPKTSYVHSYRVVMPATPSHDKGISPTVKVKVYAWSKLSNHRAVNNYGMNFGKVDMNGVAYDQSVYARWPYDAHVEFNLDHKCIKLRATFGISDNSTTAGQAEVDVQSDGTQVYTHTFDLGQSTFKAVPLDQPLKLRLEAQSTSTADGVFGLGAFGTPEVLCIH